eukprot:TRINITY_DN694_c3_g1_i1.p1 TRINITY_DN694_c3_g1~~TRINITY_DN694_c3_g1_i1.p1  ORF type:complete len:317 (-),score=70.49 TRINITY_DN694_c3_g1_i1:62-1012(-)
MINKSIKSKVIITRETILSIPDQSNIASAEDDCSRKSLKSSKNTTVPSQRKPLSSREWFSLLPEEVILHHIFKEFDVEDLSFRPDTVCKRWNSLIRSANEYYDFVQKGRLLSKSNFSNLFPFLRGRSSVNMSYWTIDRKHFSRVGSLVNCEYLSLEGCKVNTSIKHLRNLPNLKHLNISKTKINSEGISYILTINSIEILDISHCKLSFKTLLSLSQLPNLKMLVAYGHKYVPYITPQPPSIDSDDDDDEEENNNDDANNNNNNKKKKSSSSSHSGKISIFLSGGYVITIHSDSNYTLQQLPIDQQLQLQELEQIM